MTSPPIFATASTRQLLGQCIHCGLCLPACPTYSVFHTEMDGPRGRIALIQAVADSRINLNGAFQEHIDLCLGCRACETACPSGVQYGRLVEMAREAIEHEHEPSRTERIVRWLALRQMLPHRQRLRWLAQSLRLYEKSGLRSLVRRSKLLPGNLRPLENLMPPVAAGYPDYRSPAPAVGKKRGDVALLYGCVQDAFLSAVNAATVRILQRNGFQVHFPSTQSCCGAAPLHTGDTTLARELACRNIDACSDRDYVAIISNAGGCGATLKEYDRLLEDDERYAEKARGFVDKVQDISEFLADNLYVQPAGHLNVRVTYADSCHLRHAQHIVNQPRQLLESIPGVELVELQHPEMCCGSAGVYNILHADTAGQILDAKMADVSGTGAQIVVTTNTGCHLQLVQGVRNAGLDAEVVHLVELLDRAYAAGDMAEAAAG